MKNQITESDSFYKDLEKMSVHELLTHMNREDKTVPVSIQKTISYIENLVNAIVKKMKEGGRLFYIGAGTSGRLGIVDAAECPPTYGVPQGRVIGIIAGGDKAMREAVEFAEDDTTQAWKDLKQYKISKKDVVVGITASGSTPYILGGIRDCNKNGIITGCITCNPDTELAKISRYPVEVIVGPEFVTGSTRMKAGTAQKLTLNMISTSVMIRLGKVSGNRMVDMRFSNNKLIDRGAKMIVHSLKINSAEAEKLLKKHGSVRKAIAAGMKKS